MNKISLEFSDDEMVKILKKEGYAVEFVECRSLYTQSGMAYAEVCYKKNEIPPKIKNAMNEDFSDLQSNFSVKDRFEFILKKKLISLF